MHEKHSAFFNLMNNILRKDPKEIVSIPHLPSPHNIIERKPIDRHLEEAYKLKDQEYQHYIGFKVTPNYRGDPAGFDQTVKQESDAYYFDNFKF